MAAWSIATIKALPSRAMMRFIRRVFCMMSSSVVVNGA
jgi:hypothetical protein